MRIGILADTHDNIPRIQEAIAFFMQQGIEMMLHAGDFIAPFSVKILNTVECEWRGVFGNNDGERDGLQRISRGKIVPGPLLLTLGGKTIALMHDYQKTDSDIIICGHTHTPQITEKNLQLLLNPGEACGWVSGKATVALLDTETMKAEIVSI